MENISSELYSTFNDLTYYDEPHKYYLNGQELISVTTILHKYQEAFDEEYWSNKKANDYGLSPSEVKMMWNFINKKGTLKGSLIHDYAENRLLNKVFEYPYNKIINEFGFDPITKEYDITKKHVDKFINFSKNKLIPIKTEYVLYDKESMIAGMLDMLFYNVKMKEFQIWDHKTNKDFTFKSDRNAYLKDFLFTLEDCDLEIYSLQLEFYKYILEKHTNIKIGKCYVVWYSHNNPTFQIIETKNRKYYIEQIVSNRINEIKKAA